MKVEPDSPPLQIGASSRDLTPDWPVRVACHDWEPTTGFYQRIRVKALALAQGQKRVVIITADALYFAADLSTRIRARLAPLGLRDHEIILNASHAHSTPALCPLDLLTPEKIDERYRTFFVEQTVEAAVAALTSLRPGRLYRQESTCDVGINKRLHGRMVPNPEGPVDPRVRLLVARTTDGATLAVLFLYGCHPSDQKDNILGGDFFGLAQDELESLWPGTLFLSAQGTAGDVRVDHRDASGQAFVWGDQRSLDRTREFGRRLATAVRAAMAAPATELCGEIRTALNVIPVPLEAARSREAAQAMTASADPFQARWGRFMLAQYASDRPFFPASLPYTIQILRLGADFAIAALDGEVFTETGGAIERALAPRSVYVLGYCNSIAGYLPPPREIPLGGYEIDIYNWWLAPTPFTPAAEPDVIKGAVNMTRNLESNPTSRHE